MNRDTVKTAPDVPVIRRSTLTDHVSGAAEQLVALRECLVMIYELSDRLSGPAEDQVEEELLGNGADSGLTGRLADIVGDTAGVVVDIRTALQQIHESI